MIVAVGNALVIVFTITWLFGLVGWRYLFRNGKTPILAGLRWFIDWDMATVVVLIGMDLLYLANVLALDTYLPTRRLVSPMGHTVALLGGFIMVFWGSEAPN